ncbi:MAG: hypothetical protein ACNYWU_06270 [Desulfobacterales bacterium]
MAAYLKAGCGITNRKDSMTKQKITVSIKGRQRSIPCIRICSTAVVVLNGTLIKVGSVHDEFWMESKALPEPAEIIQKLRKSSFRPDVFKFAQKFPRTTPQYKYPMEWDNLAVASFDSYAEWFEKKINRSVKKHVRKAVKKGVRTDVVPFTDELVHGISAVYNSSPVRQGKKFWHYGKSFATVKAENSSYLDRSIFIGAYFEEELIGFIKLVFDGPVAHIMQILAKPKFFEKRPTNAMLSQAVKVCESQKATYLSYGAYVYGNKTRDSLVDFKRNNGFERVDIPVFYVPLSLKGHIAIKLGLHKGWRNIIPTSVWNTILSLRSKYFTCHTGLKNS